MAPGTAGVAGPQACVYSAIPFPESGLLNRLSVRRAPAPCQVPTNETLRTSSVPSVVTPALARSLDGGLATWPSLIRTPLGRPDANVKKSPLTPAVVAVGAIRRCIAVSVSVPVSVSFERAGASVVVPPGRGPVRMLIATGPLGVNWTPVSKVTPGQRVRGAATAGAARTSAKSTLASRRGLISRCGG